MKSSPAKAGLRSWLISLLLVTCAALAEISSAQYPSPPPIPTLTETFAVADDGTPLHWVVYTPHGTGPWPTILVIHGGGFRSGDEASAAKMILAAEDLRNAGYLALIIEYRLAPPGLIGAQSSDGRYPDQINDCKLAVRAARADVRCDGLVGALGGSAGATHATYLAVDGMPGDDKVEVAIGLSGAYDFSEAVSLASAGYRDKAENYCFADVRPAEPAYSETLRADSVVAKVTSSASPMLLVQSENESMPAPQMPALVAALETAGATNYQTILVPGTAHAWPNWALVKNQALSFIAAAFAAAPTPSPTPPPTPSPTQSPTPTPSPTPLPTPTPFPFTTPTPTPTSIQTPPSITTQPKKRTVSLGATARFRVAAISSTPLSYQWRKNGVNIVGATRASYTAPATTAADNGTFFSAIVSNTAGSVTSVDAALIVRAPRG